MRIYQIAAPLEAPVTLEEARAFLRLDAGEEDALLQMLVDAATTALEQASYRYLVARTLRLALDEWPACAALGLFTPPCGPALAVERIGVAGAGGVMNDLPASLWRLDGGGSDAARIVFRRPPPAPAEPLGGIEIDLVCGFGAAADAPALDRSAVLRLVACWFDERGYDPQAPAARALIEDYAAPRRVRRLA